MRDFGGSSLEPPRPWLRSHWPRPILGVPSCTGPPGAPEEAQGGGRAGALPPARFEGKLVRRLETTWLRVPDARLMLTLVRTTRVPSEATLSSTYQ